MSIGVKICGVSTVEQVGAAVRAGADFLGFNFYERSPRYVTPGTASNLAREVPTNVKTVALFVDPTDAELDRIVESTRVDFIQAHGDESAARIGEIRGRYGIPVIKAIPVAAAEDIAKADVYETVADMLLFDAKPPKSLEDALPGGNGLAFDWQLIADRQGRRPWLLSGGLDPDNVAEAIRTTGARMVDVSSGVETRPGEKNADLIDRFVRAAKVG